MDDLDPRDAEPLLDVQQAAADELVKRFRRRALVAQGAARAVQGDALPVPRIAKQSILYENAERLRLIAEAPFVKTLDNFVAAANNKLSADLIEPASDAAFIQFTAN